MGAIGGREPDEQLPGSPLQLIADSVGEDGREHAKLCDMAWRPSLGTAGPIQTLGVALLLTTTSMASSLWHEDAESAGSAVVV